MKRVLILCMGMILVLSLSACGLKIDSAEKIAAIYREHEALFQAVADVLIPYSSDELLLILFSEEDTEPQNYEVREENGIYIETSAPLSEEDYQRIFHVVQPLKEVCKLSCIQRTMTWVDFTLEKRSGKTAELYFEPDGKAVTTGFGVTDEMQINKCWYAATTSDQDTNTGHGLRVKPMSSIA